MKIELSAAKVAKKLTFLLSIVLGFTLILSSEVKAAANAPTVCKFNGSTSSFLNYLPGSTSNEMLVFGDQDANQATVSINFGGMVNNISAAQTIVTASTTGSTPAVSYPITIPAVAAGYPVVVTTCTDSTNLSFSETHTVSVQTPHITITSSADSVGNWVNPGSSVTFTGTYNYVIGDYSTLNRLYINRNTVANAETFSANSPVGTVLSPSTLKTSTNSAKTYTWASIPAGTYYISAYTSSMSYPRYSTQYLPLNTGVNIEYQQSASILLRVETNYAPSATSASIITVVNTPSAPVTPSVTDPNVGDYFTFSIVTQPTNGTVSIVNGQFVYTPNANYFGTDSFTYTATDHGGLSVTGTATVNVSSPLPSAPAGVSATQGTVSKAVGLSWSSALYANTYSIYSATTATGTKTLVASGVVGTSYQATNTTGPLYYFISATSGSGEGPMSAGVSGYPNAPPTSLTGSVSVMAGGNVAITPTVVDTTPNETFTFSLVTLPINGTASVVNNLITYAAPIGFTGSDTFTVKATDSAGGSIDGTVTVNVTPYIPPAPVGLNASQGTYTNAVAFSWAAAANVSSYSLYSATTANGSKALVQAGLTGTAYQVTTTNVSPLFYFLTASSATSGTSGYSAAATGFPNVAPSSAMASGTVMSGSSTDLIPSVIDANTGDTFSFSISTQPAHGTASVLNGKLHVVASNNYSGPDGFSFLVTDAAGATVVGNASLTIAPFIPTPPTNFVATQGTLPSAIGFNWSASANAASYSLYSAATLSGTKSLVKSGIVGTSYSYPTTVAAANYYFLTSTSASNGESGYSTGMSGFPNNPPSSASASGNVMAGNTVDITPTVVDSTPGDLFMFSIVNQPLHGVASIFGGNLRFVADMNFSGADSFTFRTTDLVGGTVDAVASVSITPYIPPAPTFVTATSGSFNNAVVVTWNTTAGLTYSVYTATSATGTKTQIASGITTGSYSHSNSIATPLYYFVVAVSSSAGQSAYSSPVVGYPNIAPTATTANATTMAATPVSFIPVTSDPNAADTFTYTITAQPAVGQGSASVLGGKLVYTPDNAHAFVGTTTFTYSATDAGGLSVNGVASVVVTTEVPSVPSGLTATDGTITGAIRVTWVTQPSAVSYELVEVIQGSPNVTIASGLTTPQYDVTVSDTLVHLYAIRSISASGGISQLSLATGGYANLPPTATSLSIQTVTQNGVGVLPSVTDPNSNEVFTFAIASQPTSGTALAQNGKITYFAVNACIGTDSFTYTVTDKGGASITGTATVVGDCSPPDFILTNFRETSPGSGIIIDKQNGSFYAKVEVTRAPIGNVNFTITNGTVTTVLTDVKLKTPKFLFNGTGQALWQQRTVTIRAAYTVNPTVFTEKTYQLVTVPDESIMTLALNNFPLTLNDTSLLSGDIQIGHRAAGVITYDAVKQGDWQVRLVSIDPSNVLTDLIAPTPLTNGALSVSGVSTVGYKVLRIAAIAKLVSPIPNYNVTVQSFTKTVMITKGTPIDGVISIPKLTGPAPMIDRVTLTIDRVSQAALGKVEWFTSFNGAPFVPADPSTLNRGIIPMKFDAGIWQVKARLLNKNSNVSSETNILTINAYAVPTITVSGLQSSMLNVPVALTASVDYKGVPINNAIVEWTIKAPGQSSVFVPLGTGYQVTVNPSVEGLYQIVARARVQGSENISVAFGVTRYMLKSMLNLKVRSILTGPKTIEVGKPQAFTAVIQPPWGTLTTNASLEGEWQLPDGTVVPGTTLNWTPTLADMSLPKQVLFRAWVTGFKPTTMLESAYKYTIWQYVWPHWSIFMTRTSQYAPSKVNLNLVMDNPKLAQSMINEGVTYTWSIPNTIANQLNTGLLVTGDATQAGTYNVSVTAADHRGNTQTATYTFDMLAPAPLAMTMAAAPSNKFYRLPLTLTVRPTITGGHPLDKPVSFTYSLNGVILAGSNTMIKAIPITTVGANTVHLEVLTKMGYVLTGDVSVSATLNVPPTCTLVSYDKPLNKTLYFDASCKDVDGIISSYAWTTNGVLTNAKGPRVTYYYASTPPGSPLTVEVKATDDAGATATATVSVTTP
jgi:hypothetical protein